MKNIRRFLIKYPFVAIPLLYVLATIIMDIAMYKFMRLSFPSRYYFSVIVLCSISGLLFFIKKPTIQYAICIFLLCVHFVVAVANIILFRTNNEITSLESLTAVPQVVSLTDYIVLDLDYMLVFSLIVFIFISIGIWLFSRLGYERKFSENHYNKVNYRRNLVIAIATLSITSYATGILYNFALPQMNLSVNSAYGNYTNDRYVYSTFSNRMRILQEFGTYSYYWSNLSYALGLKQEYEYDIPGEVIDTFTFEALPDNKQNIIMLQMETLEQSLINPYVMPKLYKFLYEDEATTQKTVEFDGYYSIDRTCVTEYSSLAGVHLDGIEMNTMPETLSPYALPNILSNYYDSVKAFHNYTKTFYRRNLFFEDGLGFKDFIAIEDMVKDTDVYSNGKNEIYGTFNQNSDYKMFLSQVENMAPAGEKFFTFVENISTHMPYYDANLFDFYTDSADELFTISNVAELENMYVNMTASDQRTVNATKSYLVGAYEYDRGLGVLFDHLRTTYALDENGNKMLNEEGQPLKLIDTTTIIFYSDHYNFTNPGLLQGYTLEGEPEAQIGANGAKLGFYVYSPIIESRTKINKFITHYDIYATISDLLHIKINTKYTLGISGFNKTQENMGFSVSTSLFFNDKYATYDFIQFTSGSIVPDANEIAAAKHRLSHILAVMNNMRSKYRNNTIRNIPETFYIIS